MSLGLGIIIVFATVILGTSA
ncbi:Protein of unknown function [Bacillus mycoides]|uniref:Uncharacterized protein n=1 Tax=Bacillus mycoides TaxID=1405 RepID=A0A1C4C9N8_BACMY|nr:Protein of unknown function [Bacillus mycoides]SCC15857.1 Protein of unknown function [Bacillus mycoides]SCM87832.1 Protein of unknown function [Bacillus mycoides]